MVTLDTSILQIPLNQTDMCFYRYAMKAVGVGYNVVYIYIYINIPQSKTGNNFDKL